MHVCFSAAGSDVADLVSLCELDALVAMETEAEPLYLEQSVC